MKFISVFTLAFIFSISSAHAIKRVPVKMAITVDDIPGYGDLPHGVSRSEVMNEVLAVFKKHEVPGVYGFINGLKVSEPGAESDSMMQDMKTWVEANYPVGNHTYSHIHLNDLSVKKYTNDIKKNEKLLEEINCGMDWKYFRYPFLNEGETLAKRNGVRKYLKNNGYKIAQVSISFRDWAWNAPYLRCLKKNDQASLHYLEQSFLDNGMEQLNRARVLSKGLFHRQVKEILLLHLSSFSAKMLDQLLTKYEKAGVKWIPFSEATRDPVYRKNTQYLGENGTAFLYQVMQSRNLGAEDFGLDSFTSFPEEDLKELCSG